MAISKLILNGEVQMDVTSDTVTAGSMLSGTTATKNDGTKATGTIASKSSSDLTVSGATVTAPAGYYSANASKSVANGSVTAPSSISVTSATVSTGTNTLTLTKSVSVTPNVTTAGYISSGTAGNSSVSLTANVTTKGAATITPSTSDQSIAAGTYLTGKQTILAMPSGTAGAPTASKGTVSNHSVSVTPSVTNTTGYITGGTKTGTAVTVSASELVSGTLNVTENGTADVTYYESVNVNVSGGSGVKYLYSDIDGEGPWDVAGYAIASYDYASIHDQKIRLWHEVPASSLTVRLRINGTNTVDWGDGSTSSISATTTHEYSQAGRYCIEVTPVSGDTRLLAVVNKREGETTNTTLKAVEYYGTSSTYYNPFGIVHSTFLNCKSLEKVDFYSPHPSQISASCFSGCTALKKVILGDTVTEITSTAFNECTSLNEVHLKSTTPPTAEGALFNYASADLKIYVPIESLSAYQTATNWSTYASQMIGE